MIGGFIGKPIGGVIVLTSTRGGASVLSMLGGEFWYEEQRKSFRELEPKPPPIVIPKPAYDDEDEIMEILSILLMADDD